MKRRLKLTPFAKLFISGLVILAGWYVYKHQNKLKEFKFFNFQDSSVLNIKADTLNSVQPEKFDTLTFYVSENDSIFRLYLNDKEIEIQLDDTTESYLDFNISQKKKLIGKIIRK